MEKYLVKTVNNTEADASGNVNINGSQTPWTSNINAAGYTLFGNSISGGTLALSSTSHATKGDILFGTSAYDEVNNRLGIGTSTPAASLDILGSGDFWGLHIRNSSVGALFQVSGGKAGFVGFNGSAYNNLDIRCGFATQLFLSTNGNIGIGTSTPAASAILDLTSTTKGLKLPTMTSTQASAIASPAKSLIVYVTDTNGTFTSAGIWIFTTSWKLILAE